MLVDLIEEELIKRNYAGIKKYVEYRNGSCGEIDLFVVKDNYVLLFEAKCTKSRKSYSKAVNQMNRAEKYYFRSLHKRVFKIMAYMKDESVVYEWIKH
jgi:Holliday junction resolvase-like predicted endonuclease